MKRRLVYGTIGVMIAIAIPLTWWGRQRLLPSATVAQPSIAIFPASKQGPGISAPLALTSKDEAAIAAVIRQQLDAFQADDAERAFSFASPGVREQFQTAERFMGLVRSRYEPVYRPQSVEFGDLEWVRGSPVQAVTVLGPAGAWTTAYYQMERQADDSWRISGCVLVPVAGETI